MGRLPVVCDAFTVLAFIGQLSCSSNAEVDSTVLARLPAIGNFRVELIPVIGASGTHIVATAGAMLATEPAENSIKGLLPEAKLSLSRLCRWLHQHLSLRAPPPDACVETACHCEDDNLLLELASSVGTAAVARTATRPNTHAPVEVASSCGSVATGGAGGCTGDLGKFCPRSCGTCLEGVVLETTRKKVPLPSDFCRDMHRPPWAWYTADGSPLDFLPTLPATLVIFEFGTWAHMPVSIGHVPMDPFRTVAMSPPIFESSGPVLTTSEISAVVSLAESRLSSSVVDSYAAGALGGHATRSSANAWLKPQDHAAVRRVFEIGCHLLRARIDQFEQLQVVRYLPGQYYHQHHDYFEYWKYPQNSDLRHNVFKRTSRGTANRVGTLLVYLSDSTAVTNFPHADNGTQANNDIDWKDCGQGLSVSPRAGFAAMFYSVLPNGTLDRNSLHAGCPSVGGGGETKWAANLWLWNVDISDFSKVGANDGGEGDAFEPSVGRTEV